MSMTFILSTNKDTNPNHLRSIFVISAHTSFVDSSRVLIGCGFFSSWISSIMCEPPSYTTDLCRNPLSDYADKFTNKNLNQRHH